MEKSSTILGVYASLPTSILLTDSVAHERPYSACPCACSVPQGKHRQETAAIGSLPTG
jgi:hypothetical protein